MKFDVGCKTALNTIGFFLFLFSWSS